MPAGFADIDYHARCRLIFIFQIAARFRADYCPPRCYAMRDGALFFDALFFRLRFSPHAIAISLIDFRRHYIAADTPADAPPAAMPPPAAIISLLFFAVADIFAFRRRFRLHFDCAFHFTLFFCFATLVFRRSLAISARFHD